MSSIGSRLECALELISECDNRDLFADIGSDHAFLALEAKRRGIVGAAIASDINELPLEKGRENADSMGIDVEFIISDGFDSFDKRDISVAAICGMGGELISKIATRSRAAKSAVLILQPMSAPEELRRALWENGFAIDKEVFTVENKKPYVLIRAKYRGEVTDFSYDELYLGKCDQSGEDYIAYCEKALASAQKRRIGIIARGESTEEIDRLIARCQAQTINL